MAFWLWVVIGVIIAALWAALASRVRVRFRYSRSGELDQLVVILRGLFGLVQYQYVMPSIVVKGWDIVYRQRAVGNVSTRRKEQASKRKFGIGAIRRYWRSYRTIERSTRKLRQWFRATMKKVECTRWRLDFRVGTGDAAETAIITGLLWTVAGCATGAAGQFITLAAHPQSRIEPNYSEKEFTAVWEADFQIRTVSMLMSALRLGRRTIRYGRALRAWKNELAPPKRA